MNHTQTDFIPPLWNQLVDVPGQYNLKGEIPWPVVCRIYNIDRIFSFEFWIFISISFKFRIE